MLCETLIWVLLGVWNWNTGAQLAWVGCSAAHWSNVLTSLPLFCSSITTNATAPPWRVLVSEKRLNLVLAQWLKYVSHRLGNVQQLCWISINSDCYYYLKNHVQDVLKWLQHQKNSTKQGNGAVGTRQGKGLLTGWCSTIHSLHSRGYLSVFATALFLFSMVSFPFFQFYLFFFLLCVYWFALFFFE